MNKTISHKTTISMPDCWQASIRPFNNGTELALHLSGGFIQFISRQLTIQNPKTKNLGVFCFQQYRSLTICIHVGDQPSWSKAPDFESGIHWFESSIPHHMEAHCLSKREIIAELYPTLSVLPYGLSRCRIMALRWSPKPVTGVRSSPPRPVGVQLRG